MNHHVGYSVLVAVLAAFLLLAVSIGSSWASAVLGGLLLAAVGAELLVKNLPRQLARLQRDNCKRENGSSSVNRSRVEAESRARLRTKMMCLLFALVLPNLFLFWLINQELVPVAVAADTAISYQTENPAWQSDLVDKRQYLRWKQRTSLPLDDDQHRSLLSRYFPLVVGAMAIWFIFCCVVTASRYLYLLREYETRLRSRAQQYFYRDMGRIQEDFAAEDHRPEPKPGMGEIVSTP